MKKEEPNESKVPERRPKQMKLRDIKNTMTDDSPISSRPSRLRAPKSIVKMAASGEKITDWMISRKRANPEAYPTTSNKQTIEVMKSPKMLNQKSMIVVESSVGLKSSKRRKTNQFEPNCDLSDPEIPTPARSLHKTLSVMEKRSSLMTETMLMHQGMVSPDFDFEHDLEHHFLLRTVERPQTIHRAFRNISGETLTALLSGMTEEQFRRTFILIDCRYPYEYAGGHIRYAMNMFDPSQVEELFYPDEEEKFFMMRHRIPIFYCEFSQKRGPGMALELRRIDRARNEEHYPHVDYKELYILDGGYSRFFSEQSFKPFCEPEHYVPMLHSDFTAQLKTFEFHKSRAERTHSSQYSLINTTTTDEHSLTSMYVYSLPTPLSSTSVPTHVELEMIHKKRSMVFSPPHPPKMSLG